MNPQHWETAQSIARAVSRKFVRTNRWARSDEVEQTVLIRLWRAVQRFTEGPTKLTTYLFMCAKYALLSIEKSHGQRRTREVLTDIPEKVREVPEYTEEVRCLLNTLDPSHRRTLRMRYLDGLSVQQTAKRMRSTVSQVYKRTHTALEQLRRSYVTSDCGGIGFPTRSRRLGGSRRGKPSTT